VLVVLVVLFVLPTNHHVVVVVRAVGTTPQAAPSASGGGPQSPRAPSTQQVEQELHKAEAANTGGTEVGTATSVLGAGASASFAKLSRTLPDRVALAVVPLSSGRAQVLGGDVAAHGWSTTKVPVLVALMKARGSRGLTGSERALAHAAITASDNESILALFGDLKQLKGGLIGASDYMQGLFRLSGDEQTAVATAPPPSGAVTTFGQTQWSPVASVKFFSALGRGCLLPSASQTSYVLDLMQNIETSESWGLGSAGFRSVAFKGGWGPERSGGYLVRQAGIVNVGSSRAVAVAIVAFPSGSGSFSDGIQTLTQTATWLRRHLRPVSHPSTPCPAG
jgi:hypothetical protein